MRDHFVLLVDRLLTESTLEAAIQSNNRLQHFSSAFNEDNVAKFSPLRMDTDVGSSPRNLVECRICHDEDEDLNMEIPCSCSGSLKYAHRACVQRWCNEKGDTICEICRQNFKPGYTAPSPLSHYVGISRNFRRGLHDTEFIPMVSMDGSFFDADFDVYPSPSSRSLICCRIVAIVFTVLLVLRHTLPVILSDPGEYSLTMFMLIMLRIIGILLPIYIMVKALTAVQRCRRQESDPSYSIFNSNRNTTFAQTAYIVSRNSSLPTSNVENELPLRQPPEHLTHLW